MNMEWILTDEKDKRFLSLVDELDLRYFELIGDELSKYETYNEFSTPHVVGLAFKESHEVACASYRVLDEISVEFKRVYVKKDFRKRGIAFKLISELEKLVVSDDFKYSYIVTGKHNHAAIRLYEKLDYEITEKFGQFRDDERVICMKKKFE